MRGLRGGHSIWRHSMNKEYKPSKFDRMALNIAPQWALRRIYAKTVTAELSTYKAASTGRLRKGWGLFRSDSDAPLAERKILQQRSRDASRNDPIASGAIDTIRQNVVGTGLRPQSMLRAKMLGITEERAKEIRQQIETAWERFTVFADSANILSFDEIQFLVMSKVIEDGEVLAIPTWANEPWRPYSRCVEILNASRLDSFLKNNINARNGIVFGDRGQPLKYSVRKVDKKTGRLLNDYNLIDARDQKGRPKILHLFPTSQPGQTRGIPLFAPVLTYFKDLADYLEAEIVAARIAACLAVFITKNDPMGMAMATGTKKDEKTGKRLTSIEPGMIGHLATNESIQVVDPKRPGDTFPSTIESILRIIGVSIGLPYELIAKDFSKTNYSSARASLLEGRRVFKTWRKWLTEALCKPIWALVVEEAYLRGNIDISDFYENQHEYIRSQWIGGAWGWVDPVKEIQAAKNAVDWGFSTYADEIGSLGGDWQEVFDQRKIEQSYIDEISLRIASQENEKNANNNNSEEKKDE